MTAPFELFRRPAEPHDGLSAARSPAFRTEIGMQLESYDPALIRRIVLPQPSFPLRIQLGYYVIIGQGARPEVGHWACVRALSAHERKQWMRSGVLFLRAATTTGPTFCFLARFGNYGKIRLTGSGLCSTLADVSQGYALTQIDQHEGHPQFFVVAGLVPDGVATVALRYLNEPPIQAQVNENVYWARVPRFPQIVAHRVSPAALNRMIRHELPINITWLAADGREVRSFSPPTVYMRRLLALDEGCAATDCGR